MKNRIDSSRHKTPWDNQTNVTASQEFIRNKYNNNYVCKHPKLIDTKENELINSIEITNCRVCGSINIKKKGFTKNGIQRYYCNNCKKFFNPLTNTIFENHKISISEWIEFLFNIFNYGSITLTSKVNKNGVNTSSYWLHKIFLILKNCQDTTILDGKVYIDEMFYKVIKSDIKLKNGKQLRGLSSNQYCIGIGYDGKNIIAIVEGLGKTSSTKTKNTFLNHISENSTLIHDDEKSHHALLDSLKLNDESYKSTWLKTLDDSKNPLRPINHQCDLIRQFLNAHSGFDREDLQDYLNLYCFMNSNFENKLVKIDKLINMSLTANVTLKYRELFKK